MYINTSISICFKSQNRIKTYKQQIYKFIVYDFLHVTQLCRSVYMTYDSETIEARNEEFKFIYPASRELSYRHEERDCVRNSIPLCEIDDPNREMVAVIETGGERWCVVDSVASKTKRIPRLKQRDVNLCICLFIYLFT